jgi:stage V sporulation protein AC
MEKKEYLELVKKTAPRSNELKSLLTAFIVGGFICCIGQAVFDILNIFIKNLEHVATFTSMIMIFIGSLLTGVGVYDYFGHYAGAGTIIPITGFANSMTSPAMEYNREGIVFGVMSKMFVIAGPIIVSGIVISVLVGLIYWVVGL